MTPGRIGPGIEPESQRQAEFLRLVVKRGLVLERRGGALVLRGPGVHVVARDLGSFGPSDTSPPTDRYLASVERLIAL